MVEFLIYFVDVFGHRARDRCVLIEFAIFDIFGKNTNEKEEEEKTKLRKR